MQTLNEPTGIPLVLYKNLLHELIFIKRANCAGLKAHLTGASLITTYVVNMAFHKIADMNVQLMHRKGQYSVPDLLAFSSFLIEFRVACKCGMRCFDSLKRGSYGCSLNAD